MGGYIAAGATSSTAGQVVGNHGGTDAWLLKLSPGGGLLWQRCLGGAGDEAAYGVIPTADGGYAIAGYTNSSDGGDVAGQHGSSDGWVVKVNRTGTIEWQRCLGGTGPDVLHAIRQTPEGGYIAAGCTYSNSSGDIGNTKGNGDLWLVKLTGTGIIDWQETYGGQQHDSAFDIYPAGDGGYIVAGSSASDDGDVIGHRPGADFWVLRINSAGAIRWQRSLGGSGNDSASTIRPEDSGWIVVGTVHGGGYDVTGYRGGVDIWVVELDDNGNLIWQQALGTERDDLCTGVVPTADGCVLGGSTWSTGGIFSENHGMSDVLAFRLLPPAVSEPEPAADYLSLSPGWNFVSTPRRLADGYNTAAALFGGLDTDGHSIVAYDASTGKWSAMTAASIIRPLDGIWVYSKAAVSIPLTFATGEARAPPSKALSSGWNAVGIASTGHISARDCLLTVQNRWTAAIGWDAAGQHYRTSIINGGSGINSDDSMVYPTEGVWVFMAGEGTLGAVSG